MLRGNENTRWFVVMVAIVGCLAVIGSAVFAELPSFPTQPPKVRNLAASQGVQKDLDDWVYTYYDLENFDTAGPGYCEIKLEFRLDPNSSWEEVDSLTLVEPNTAECIVWDRGEWTGGECKVRLTAEDTELCTAQMESDVFRLESSSHSERKPEITNVSAEQRNDASRLVDIYYDLSIDDPNYQYYVYVKISTDEGASFDANACRGVSGAVGAGQEAGEPNHIIWNPAIDLPGESPNDCVVKVLAHGFADANSNVFKIQAAGPGDLEGAVYDGGTGEGIENAIVAVFEANTPPDLVGVYYTEPNGTFGPGQLSAGEKIIVVVPPGAYYHSPKTVTIAESSHTFVNIMMTNLLGGLGGSSYKTTSDSPEVKEVRGKYCGPDKHIYYLNGISLQESFEVNIDWGSNTPNEVRWEIWEEETLKRTYEQPCSGDEVTRTFDMGDIGEGTLVVVAVSDTNEESTLYPVNLDVIPRPPIVNLIPAVLYIAVPTGEGFEYRPLGMSGLEILLGDKEPDSGIPIFGHEMMEVALDLGGEPEEDPEKDHGDFDGSVSGKITSDGKAEMFSVGWDNEYKKETRKNVKGKKKIKLPSAVTVSPSASLEFAFYWFDPNDEWEPGGTLDLGCNFMYATPSYVVGGIPLGFVVVPIYVRAELNLPLGLSITVTGWIYTGPEWSGSFDFEPLAKGILGAGVAKVACVEGYLGGGFHAGIILPSVEWQEPYIVLVGGAQVVLGPFSAGLPLRREWHNPTTPPLDATSFELMLRDYLDPDPCDFLGEIQLAGGTENAVAPNMASYPYSVPDVVRIRDVNPSDDDMLAVWIRDNVTVTPCDFEPDEDVDFADFAVFANHWKYNDCSAPDWCDGTDLDKSGDVNTADLGIIAEHWLNTRDSIDRTELVYATYNSSLLDDNWSAPEPVVAGNLTADMNPQLISFGDDKAACIWQDAKPGLVNSDGLKKFLSQMEIAVSIYNGATWQKTPPVTTNNRLDRSPRIAGPNENNMLAVWISNDSNDPWGKKADAGDFNQALNDIMWSKWDGSIWTTGPNIDSGVGTILGTTLAYNGSTAAYVFCVDPNSGVDPNDDPNHANDQELWMATYSGDTWSATQQLTNNHITDAAPGLAYDKNDNLLLFWVKGDDICMATGSGGTIEFNDVVDSNVIITPGASMGVKDFDLVMDNRAWPIKTGQMALVWSDASMPFIDPNEPDPNHFQVGYDIWVAYYEPNMGLWSKPRQLTWDDAAERFISGAFDSYGDLLCVYDKTQTKYEDDPNCFTIDGNDVIVEDVPKPGRSDLYYMKYQMGVDLSVVVEDLRIDPPNPLPGTEPTISARIKNIGEFPASGVEVNFSYKDYFVFEDPCGIKEPNIVQFDSNDIAIADCPNDLVGGDSIVVEVKWRDVCEPNIPDPNDYVPLGWPIEWEVRFSRKLYAVVSSYEDPNDERSNDGDPNNDSASCETMRPDVTVSEMAVQKADPNYIITVRVANKGALEANNIEVVLREDDPNEGTVHGYENVAEIAAGAFYDVPFTVPAITEAYAIVDPNETIDEFNEDNNIRSVRMP